MFYLFLFILLIIIIPKHTKVEKEASHLFIDMYKIPVKKVKNPVKQVFLIEKYFNIKGFHSYQITTLWIIFGSIIGGAVLALLGVAIGTSINNPTLLGTLFFLGLFILIVGVIYSWIRIFRMHSKIRPQSWIKLFNYVDPELDTQFMQEKKWQKFLLLTLIENKN